MITLPKEWHREMMRKMRRWDRFQLLGAWLNYSIAQLNLVLFLRATWPLGAANLAAFAFSLWAFFRGLRWWADGQRKTRQMQQEWDKLEKYIAATEEATREQILSKLAEHIERIRRET